ncbi:MAG: thioredoxin family protein [Deltaproteobacteria bacterium]|nr:thioredoxin family protein [Deltaproteobacteria bacterium]
MLFKSQRYLLNSLKGLSLVLLLVFAASSHANPIKTDHAQAYLISPLESLGTEQESFWLLFELKIDPHWHTYWQNPGDSGLAPKLKWKLPPGWEAGPIVWQAPKRLPLGPLVNYGYEHHAYHLVKLQKTQKASKNQKPNFEIQLQAKWLICQEDCIPEEAQLSLNLGYGNKKINPQADKKIQELLRSANFKKISASFEKQEDSLSLHLNSQDLASHSPIQSLYFYPKENGLIESAAPQTWENQGDQTILKIKKGSLPLPDSLTGLLEIQGPQKSYLSIEATLLSHPKTSINPTQPSSLWMILLLAFLGGIILNAMPCVFPVLSLKALSLSKKARNDHSKVILHGLSYTLGILLSFAVLGGLLLILRKTYPSLAWGYQMQSPLFVGFLIYLFFLIGLNLLGYFPLYFQPNLGNKSASQDNLLGSFVTGSLATIIATPCTAPFMAGALGVALSQDAFTGMMIFLSLGFGLAFPYLIFALLPTLRKILPKPGAWMETFQQALSFPIFLTLVWLFWVLMQQVDSSRSSLVLLGLILITFARWLYSKLKLKTWVARLSVALILGLLSLVPLSALPPTSQNKSSPKEGLSSQNYSAKKLAELLEKKEKVFVYATAAWCLTCQVNEKVALGTEKVKSFLEKENIKVLKADWTNEDPEITIFLEQFGRAGVPLYVYYPSQEQKPRVLPQLLSPKLLIDHLKKE